MTTFRSEDRLEAAFWSAEEYPKVQTHPGPLPRYKDRLRQTTDQTWEPTAGLWTEDLKLKFQGSYPERLHNDYSSPTEYPRNRVLDVD